MMTSLRPPGIASTLAMAAGLAGHAVGWMGCCAGGRAWADVEQPVAILDVLSTPSEELAAGREVRIRGVVTWHWKPERAHCIVQDDTAGIWINIVEARARNVWAGGVADAETLTVGDEVEIEGLVDQGGYAPSLLPRTIRFVGRRPLPAPVEIDDEQFFGGGMSLCRIVVEGVVQGVQGVQDYGGQDCILLLERSSRPFVATVSHAFIGDAAERLIDARVRLTGILSVRFNTRGQYLHPTVDVVEPEDVQVVTPPPAGPFDAPFTPLGELAHFRPGGRGGHRVRTKGSVSMAAEGAFFVQEGSTGVRVTTRAEQLPSPGDEVEIAGFIDRSRDFAGLKEAVFRIIDHGPPPDPRRLSPAMIIDISRRARATGQMAKPGDFDGCLIRFTARLTDTSRSADGIRLALDSDGEFVDARISRGQASLLPALEPGCTIDITGILQTELGGHYRAKPLAAHAQETTLIDRLTLLVPSADDVRLVTAAPWWNARRLATAVASLAAVLLAALAWVVLLRRQVASQARRLAGEMQKRREAAVEYQASLRERNRLAANLHDTLLQTLAGVGFQLDTCRRAVGRDDLGDTSENLDVARRMVNRAVGELRSNVWSLKTMPLAGQPFSQALEAIVSQLRGGHATRLETSTRGEPFEMPRFVTGNLLLIVQEAIRNSVRHGRPSRVTVDVGYEPAGRTVEIEVVDDGCGFAVDEVAGPTQGHFGLEGMRERIASLGGTLAVESRPGVGTRVTARVTTPNSDREIDET